MFFINNRQDKPSAEKTSLSTNILGEIFGFLGLHLVKKKLIVTKRRGNDTYDLESFNSFVELFPGILGLTLTVKDSNHVKKYRFLSSYEAMQFADALNAIIAINITNKISRLIVEIDRKVIQEYPRDSWSETIKKTFSDLSDLYSYQRNAKDKYLSPALTQKVREFLALQSLQLSELRDYHEKITLKKRQGFYDLVESHPLTEEQRLAVIRSNDINLVLAAAGTGKTSVIIAKVLDLLDRGLASTDEILILAYNRNASKELSERLSEKAENTGIGLNRLPVISTFHSLGRMILREVGINTHLSVLSEDEVKLKQWITEWLEEYLSQHENVNTFINLFPEPINPFDFESDAQYQQYIRDNDFRTLNDELVKGYQELLIANFLFINGIPYKYEAPYVTKRRIDVGFDYKPDFYLKRDDIYIEHFGIDRDGNTRPDIDPLNYNESIHKKRLLHEEYETTLIETFHYEWCEERLLDKLKEKLEQHHVQFSPLPASEIFEKLRNSGRISSSSDIYVKALKAIRVEGITNEQIVERLKSNAINQPNIHGQLLADIHAAYKAELKSNDTIDFDDMILRASEAVETGMCDGKWKYILVDEFQDISESRMRLVQALVKEGLQTSLTVVGDDWQSIYRFSGGKLELTTRFNELVGMHSSTKLQKTFRYNNSIADTAGQFIMANPEQYKKSIQTHVKTEKSEVYLLDNIVDGKPNLALKVTEIVKKIKENDPLGEIAIIARYNYLLSEIKQELKPSLCKRKVHFWSFHKSKGLEADYVVLVGLTHGKLGFPNENHDEALVEALLPSLDEYPHSEERRLMYVGLTRARQKVYLVADPTAPSDFVIELLSPKFSVNIHSKTLQEEYRKIFKCPNCVSGFLKLIQNGKYGDFYSCSSGVACNVGKARVCSKCGSPSIDGRHESVCNNTYCRHSIKICQRCGRPMKLREGRWGRFWGCSGYGIVDDRCRHKEKA